MSNFNNVRSKLNRGIAAYLIKWNPTLADVVVPAHAILPKQYPIVIVKANVGRRRDGISGVYDVQVQIEIRGSAVAEQEQSADNTDLRREEKLKAFYDLVGLVKDNLMVTDVTQQTLYETAKLITEAGRELAANTVSTSLNSDMADFTVQMWAEGGFGDGEPEEAGCDWAEILLFDAQVCGKNVD